MAVMNGGTTEKANGGVLSSTVVEDENSITTTGSLLSSPKAKGGGVGEELGGEDISLYGVFNHLIESIFNQNSGAAPPPPMADRIRKSFIEAAPMFREAILNTRRDLLLWTRRGSPLRALLVASAGIVSLLALTGMLVFMVFVVAATVNAIAISLLISLAAVGGFLAIFFACLTVMYIVVLLMAACLTFTITISSIMAALVAAGWIGFIWITWVAVSKTASLAKRIVAQHSQVLNSQ